MKNKTWVARLSIFAALISLSSCKTPDGSASPSPSATYNPDRIMSAQYQDLSPIITWTTAGNSKAVFNIQEQDIGQPWETIFTVDCSTGVCNPGMSGAAVGGHLSYVVNATTHQEVFTLELCNLSNLAALSTTKFQIISANNPPVPLVFNNGLAAAGGC